MVHHKFLSLRKTDTQAEIHRVRVSTLGKECRFFQLTNSNKKGIEKVNYVTFTCEFAHMSEIVVYKFEEGKTAPKTVKHSVPNNQMLNLKISGDASSIYFAAHMGNIIQFLKYDKVKDRFSNWFPINWRKPGDLQLFANDIDYGIHSVKGIPLLSILSPGEKYFRIIRINLTNVATDKKVSILEIKGSNDHVFKFLSCDTVIVDNTKLKYLKSSPTS